MASEQKKYDVAFSFRAADLATAERLADLIQPLSSFVYARKQGEIVTTDGTETFGRVFGSESRLNVVLYRTGYGIQGWTEFERGVITGRCLKESWDSFALFVTDGSAVPGWVPPTYIYGDLSVMDLDAIAGVIRYRAQRVGADVRRESAEDRLRRLAEAQAFSRETEQMATSREAHAEVNSGIDAMFEHISTTIARVASPDLPGNSGAFSAYNLGANLGSVGVYLNYQNRFGRVTGGEMRIRYFAQTVSVPGRDVMMGRVDPIHSETDKVVRTRSLQWCWELEGKPRSAIEIAEHVLSELYRFNGEVDRGDWSDDEPDEPGSMEPDVV